ncbi:uncharacterized protein ACIGJ3_014720 [Trichechus inunguis]
MYIFLTLSLIPVGPSSIFPECGQALGACGKRSRCSAPRMKFRGTVTRSATLLSILLCPSATRMATGHNSWGKVGLQSAHRPGVLGVLDEVPSIEQLILHRLQGAQPQGPHLLLHTFAQPLQHLEPEAVSGGSRAPPSSQGGVYLQGLRQHLGPDVLHAIAAQIHLSQAGVAAQGIDEDAGPLPAPVTHTVLFLDQLHQLVEDLLQGPVGRPCAHLVPRERRHPYSPLSDRSRLPTQVTAPSCSCKAWAPAERSCKDKVKGERGSRVADRLMWPSVYALLKNCLKAGGASRPFLRRPLGAAPTALRGWPGLSRRENGDFPEERLDATLRSGPGALRVSPRERKGTAPITEERDGRLLDKEGPDRLAGELHAGLGHGGRCCCCCCRGSAAAAAAAAAGVPRHMLDPASAGPGPGALQQPPSPLRSGAAARALLPPPRSAGAPAPPDRCPTEHALRAAGPRETPRARSRRPPTHRRLPCARPSARRLAPGPSSSRDRVTTFPVTHSSDTVRRAYFFCFWACVPLPGLSFKGPSLLCRFGNRPSRPRRPGTGLGAEDDSRRRSGQIWGVRPSFPACPASGIPGASLAPFTGVRG